MADLPHLPLDDFRRHGHELVDWIADYLETLDDRPVLPSVEPGEIRSMIPTTAPENPEEMDEILADLDRVVLPGIAHWQHPGWFAYFPASSSPAAVLGELAAVGLAVQGMLWSSSPAATEIESAVLDWLVDLLGLPETWRIDTGPGGGVLQMSASDSTHTSLVVARQLATDSGADIADLVAYGSAEAHSSIEKGARVAGFGHIRAIEVDDAFAMDADALLAAAVKSDLAAGLHPTWVCSAVGTTGTTAVDPVAAVSEIAAEYGMWHHVDAAYAGSAMICPELRHYQEGAERADSYTFNPHKWLLTNFDCSVFWVADRAKLIETLSITPPYLRDASGAGDVVDYRDWHVPLGRRFRALKLWFVLRSYGAEGLRGYIRGHLDLARQLTDRIEADERLELIAPTTFALVSFRHRDGAEATRALAEAINATGSFYVTPSVADDSPFIRVSIGSTWTEPCHVDASWDLIAELA